MAEQEIRNWIRAVTNDNAATDGDIVAALKSGVVLCKLVNVLKPGTISKVNDYASAFRQAENLQAFTTAAKVVFSVSDADLFAPEDLQQGRNIPKVLLCVASLATNAHTAGQSSHVLQNVSLDELRREASEQAAKNATNPGSKKAASQLSLFEQQQAKAQQQANNASRGNIMKSTEHSYSGASSMTFAEEHQARAQKEASKANTSARTRQIVQVEGGAGSQTALSMVEVQQSAAQKHAADVHQSKNQNVRSSGKHLGGFSVTESRQMEAQKLASGALNTKHNVARVGNDGAGANVLSMAETKQMESQKMVEGHTGVNSLVRLPSNTSSGPVVNTQ